MCFLCMFMCCLHFSCPFDCLFVIKSTSETSQNQTIFVLLRFHFELVSYLWEHSNYLFSQGYLLPNSGVLLNEHKQFVSNLTTISNQRLPLPCRAGPHQGRRHSFECTKQDHQQPLKSIVIEVLYSDKHQTSPAYIMRTKQIADWISKFQL